tara:strand:+ start:10090 stop:10404 length:315 start_codon:yes stop_codon:yes gene_type:complete
MCCLEKVIGQNQKRWHPFFQHLILLANIAGGLGIVSNIVDLMLQTESRQVFRLVAQQKQQRVHHHYKQHILLHPILDTYLRKVRMAVAEPRKNGGSPLVIGKIA